MLERFGIEQSDIRKLQIVFLVMTFIMAFLIEAPIVARVIVASIMGLISATAFLVVTVLMKQLDVYSY